MKHRPIAIAISAAVAVAALTVQVVGRPAPLAAQQRACLHGPDETPEQMNRRRQAVQTARQINTAEARQSPVTGVYVALAELAPAPVVPPGFKVALMADTASYTFSIKDTLDPCRFALFSDQDGLIFEARPMQ